MGLFLVVFLFMVTVIIAMSIGVLMGRKPIAGSCGGMSALGMKTACEICGGNDQICEEETAKREQQKLAQNVDKAAALSYDATTPKQ